MAVTRSWAAAAPVLLGESVTPRPALGIAWLLAASLFVSAGLAVVYTARLQRISGNPLNVNAVQSSDELLPVLEAFPDRVELAPKVYDYLLRARPLPNAGALTRVIPRHMQGEILFKFLGNFTEHRIDFGKLLFCQVINVE